METPSSGGWSELPVDILRYLLERLSFSNLHCAKIVCSNWYLCSKQTLRPKFGSPLLIMSQEEDDCCLYSPEEDRAYKTTSDISGYQFLGNSGMWFLVIDSKSDLYIVDVFSHERIVLPHLETLMGGLHEIQRVGENEFKDTAFAWDHDTSKDLRGFCKRGDVHYREITLRTDVRRELRGVDDMVLKGYNLYFISIRKYIRHLDLSGQDGVKDVLVYHNFPMSVSRADEKAMNAYKAISASYRIVVPTSGEPLFLYT
ncbi:unnamed protein product [Eruca vesicaria subsp. sativa]|uniref:F-box domain-containing protein n=1 Tax=Eruca vesicaria subsp. sativa TaxID=29727 RepID=A0ABC8JN67_ERUVS|nr:unnamed protein product [Eruca vesicaria subsp. sativa]